MKKILFLSTMVSLFLISCQQEKKEIKQTATKTSTEISFYAKDSIQVFADLFVTDKKSPTIILFHQARANARGEYKTIIPVLVKEGFNVLAVDQRTGGQYFGNYNRTVAKLPLNRYTYCDAYPDLEAALAYVKNNEFSEKIVVWGSSYSAALVIKLGFENPTKIDGVLAFSPASGKPMGDCDPTEYIKKIQTKLFVLRPESEMQYESVKQQFELAKAHNHTTYISKNGVHGSSMLVESRTKSSNEETWKAVKDFLSKFKN